VHRVGICRYGPRIILEWWRNWIVTLPERVIREDRAGETDETLMSGLRPSRGVGEKRPPCGGGSGAAKHFAFGRDQFRSTAS